MHRTVPPGFTLIELVVTIIMIAILAVTALPRLLSTASYSAHTLQDELIAELRQTQMLALNNSDRCYRVNITAAGYQIQHYPARDGSNQCQGSVLRTEALQALPRGTTLSRVSDSSSNFHIDFDVVGRVIPSCSGSCITVNADQSLTIMVEAEGYIHGGE